MKHVVALSAGMVTPVFGFIYAAHLSIVAFALHALDSVGGTLGVCVGALACLTMVFLYLYIGVHITTNWALATHHQSFWVQMDVNNVIAWVASGRRALTERIFARARRSHLLLPEEVRRSSRARIGHPR